MQRRKAVISVLSLTLLSLLLVTTTVIAISEGSWKESIAFPSLGSQTSAPPSAKYWYVGAYSNDSVSFSNEGVRSEIQVRNQQIDAFLAFWVSDTMSSNLWAQIGYYFFHGSGPTAFFQIWNLTTRTEVGSGSADVSIGVHVFSMMLSHGVVWKFLVDSQSIGTYDMHANKSSPTDSISALSEEGYCDSPFSFHSVTFSQAMQVLRNGKWMAPRIANAYGSAWGLQGVAENSTLTSNQIIVGGNYFAPPAGSTLWS